ncbi:MAG: hypothetical protein AABX27_00825 [Nanoarchaeota archaeon]
MTEADYNGRKLEDIIYKIRQRDDVFIHDIKSATGIDEYDDGKGKKTNRWIEAFHYLVVPKVPIYPTDLLNTKLFSMQEDTNPDFTTYSRNTRRGISVGKLFFYSKEMELYCGKAHLGKMHQWAVINLLPSKGLADSFLVSSCFSEIQKSIEIPKRDLLLDKAKTMGRRILRIKY